MSTNRATASTNWSRSSLVCAIISARGSDGLMLERLSDHVKSSLALYKAPRPMVVVEEIERDANGKIYHKKFRRIAADAVARTSS